jgi:hypothetical protein
MRQPFGSTDFFALEAGDCLDRLERLLAHPEGVPGDEFVRQVRLLRGAALMAHLQPIAQAGAAFEGLARAVRDGARPWDAATRELALGALDDFRGLVRRAADWGPDDDAGARRLATELAGAAGSRPVTPAAADASADIRSFVARQGAQLAAALADAARALGTGSELREALDPVLSQLQPLRGLAGLSDLGAVPDLLDGIELAVTGLRQAQAPQPAGAALLAAAAHALADAASGAPDAPAVPAFATMLLAHLGADADVVPIETLFLDGDPAPCVTVNGAPPPLRRGLGAVELVSQGEHFTQVADRLADARAGAERDLRLAGLFGTLHALQSAGSAVPGIAAFARDALRRVAGGDAAREPTAFAAHLRRAADLLRRAGEAPETFAPNAWESLLRAAPEAVAPRAAGADADVVPIERLLLEDEIVPVAALAPDTPASSEAVARSAFESSVDAYMRRVRDAVPAGPVTPVVSAPVVAITELVYRGSGARTRAVELHAEVGRRLRDGHDWSALRPLVEEILDLVPLALDVD